MRFFGLSAGFIKCRSWFVNRLRFGGIGGGWLVCRGGLFVGIAVVVVKVMLAMSAVGITPLQLNIFRSSTNGKCHIN